ncbi:MAG: Bax inhibitor-1 family protein [Candidatus Korobacteraceae bacterium]
MPKRVSLATTAAGLEQASVVNISWHSSGLYWVVTYAGILIFVGLTAYDAQKIKRCTLREWKAPKKIGKQQCWAPLPCLPPSRFAASLVALQSSSCADATDCHERK